METFRPRSSVSGDGSVEGEPGTWQWRMLMAGTALALSVYYLHYGTTFDEGDIDASNPLTLVGRLISVVLLVVALRPIRLRIDSALALTLLYFLALGSFIAAWAMNGYTNDTFFLNTALQLPVLLALNGTRLRVDYARWLRFIVCFVALEAMIDVIVVANGSALWISGAFVGGVGNPSSFGLICAIACAFCLLNPRAGWGRRPLGIGLAGAAIMTKSLFAVLAIAIIAVIWASRSWRRFIGSAVLGCVLSVATYYFALGGLDDEDPSFLANKLRAAGALLGFVSYDVDSSDSVSERLEIHRRTYAAVRDEPWQFLYGHLHGQVYWPMDSQVLTYFGSFGIAMLLAFLLIHTLWTRRAWLNAKNDGGFSFVALLLFSLIFLTNRILDYFPVASLYFLCVMSARQRSRFPPNEFYPRRHGDQPQGEAASADRNAII
jgi:hypothetical protein